MDKIRFKTSSRVQYRARKDVSTFQVKGARVKYKIWTQNIKTCPGCCVIVCQTQLHSPAPQAALPPQSTGWQAVCGWAAQARGPVWPGWGLCRRSPALPGWRCPWTHSSRPAWPHQPGSPPGSRAWWRRPHSVTCTVPLPPTAAAAQELSRPTTSVLKNPAAATPGELQPQRCTIHTERRRDSHSWWWLSPSSYSTHPFLLFLRFCGRETLSFRFCGFLESCKGREPGGGFVLFHWAIC